MTAITHNADDNENGKGKADHPGVKEMIKFVYADRDCLAYLKSSDKHLTDDMLLRKIANEEIIVMKDAERMIGVLRYSLFWDKIPFMNFLMIDEFYRGKGFGKILVEFWEKEMRNKNHGVVITSTLATESAQHFYRKIGYKEAGCLLLEEGLEILFKKEI